MAIRQHRHLFLVMALVALAAVVAACGGGGNQASQSSREQQAATTAPTTQAPSTPTPTAPAPTAPPESSTPGPSAGGQAAGAAEGAIVIVASDEGGRFRFEPDRIEVRAGQQVTLRVVNRGPSPHDMSIQDLKVDTGQFNPGEERTVTFTAPNRPGEYQFICTVPGHLQLGMKGTLVVR